MVKIDRTLGREASDNSPPLEERTVAGSTLANPSQQIFEAFLATPGATGISVTPDKALTYTAVYAAIRVLAESIGGLPLVLYERVDTGAGEGRQKATDHSLYELLRWQPNERQTAFEAQEHVVFSICSYGNSYRFIQKNRAGQVIALWPLRADKTRIEVVDGNLIYVVSHGSSGEVVFDESEILHEKLFSKDGIVGLSPIRAAREAIGAGLAMEQYAGSFFNNSATPPSYLEYPGVLTPERRKSLREQWEKIHRGALNANRTAVLEDGMKLSTVSISPEDSQFVESRQFQLQEISRIFRVPPHMLSDLSKSSFNNIEQQSIDFVTHNLRPWLRRLEQGIRHKLLDDQERKRYFAEFMVQDLLRGDTESRYKAYRIAREDGWMSANEIRQRENLNPIENGDVYLVPVNQQPVEDVIDGEENEDRSAVLEATVSELRQQQESIIEKLGKSREDKEEIREEAEAESQPQEEVIEETLRSRLISLHQKSFRKLATSLIDEEVAVVADILDSDTDIRLAIEQFYEERKQEVTEEIRKPVEMFAAAVREAALEEIDSDSDTPALQKFLDNVIDGLAHRWVNRAKGSLLAVMKSEDPKAAVRERLQEWRDSKAEAFARSEPVQIGNAIARAVFVESGITQFRWSCRDGNPFCKSLDGHVVNINQPFVKRGQEIGGEGDATIEAGHNVNHPPLLNGCNCEIQAVIGGQ